MNADRRAVGALLLAAFAMAWPWDVYQYLPVPGLRLTSLLALFLIAWAAHDAAVTRRLRVPFELLWPAAALGMGCWVLHVRNEYPRPWAETGCLLLFLATTHLSPGSAFGERCVRYTAALGGCLALFSIAARPLLSGFVIPTAYSLDTGSTAFGSQDVAGGVWTLAICLTIALWRPRFAHAPRADWQTRALWLGTAAVLFLALVQPVTAILSRPEAWHLRPAFPFDLSSAVVVAVLAWLVARVAAKLEVERRESHRPAFSPFLLILGVSTLFFVLASTPVRAHHAFLLGLAASAGKRKDTPIPSPKGAWLMPPIILGLGLVNAVAVFAQNRHDPRNYDVAAARDLEAGDHGLLARRMTYFENLGFKERKTHFWRAQSALARGHPRTATTEFVAALEPLRPKERTILAPLSPEEVEEFQMRLRAVFSAIPGPADHFGYERALVAQGKIESALGVLRMRLQSPRPVPGPVERGPVAEALAFLLGDATLGPRFASWSAAELLSVLESSGARVLLAPEGFPSQVRPLILAAQTTPSGLELWAGCPDASQRAAIPGQLTPASSGSLAWEMAQRDSQFGTNRWEFQLKLIRYPTPLARIVVGARGLGTLDVYTHDRLLFPDATAVLILL